MAARLLIFACLGFSGLMIALWIRDAGRAAASARWPTVEGEILESVVVPVQHDRRRSGRQPRHSYRARVRFGYEVAGATHEADTVRFLDTWSSDRAAAEGVANRYPKGARVEVHYDPQSPNRAVLDTGTGSRSLGLPLFGAGVFALGGVLLAVRLWCKLRLVATGRRAG
ncbi:MAG: DUF3592 domain-containing protein [Planctomycetes bacterium]|nr:DUF3592 domain-containing protein [Planctomycetota bacterium]MCB9868419.1 DUF3592 domain-containing protein [Planctomycetota bacterium]